MSSKRSLFLLALFFGFVFLIGCVSSLHRHAFDVVESYQSQIEKHVKSRNSQIDVRLGFLNDDMLKYKYDDEITKKIKAEIEKLHEEQRFLYTLNYEQFRLEYEIVEETKNAKGLRNLILKVKGKTLNLTEEGRSEIIEIPKESSYWLFKEYELNDKKQISGPLPVPKDKLKELTEPKEKSTETTDFKVTESTPSESS